MPQPPILSSPFLAHSVLDTLLSKTPSPQDKIQLLSAKIHLYANGPNPPASHPPTARSDDEHTTSSTSEPRPEHLSRPNLRAARVDKDRIPEMRTRLDLAAVQLAEMKGTLASQAYGQQAEATLRIVLDWTRGVVKGIERRERVTAGIVANIEKGAEVDERSTPLPVGSDRDKADEGAYDGWTGEVLDIRRKALRMMIQLEEGMGRAGRIGGLRKQLGDVEVMRSRGHIV